MTLPKLDKRSYLVLGLCGLMVVFAVVTTAKQRKYESRILDLQNQLASRDKTIEVSDGLYKKLTIETDGLKGLLDGKDKQNAELKQQLDRSKQQLVNYNSVVLKLRQQLSGAGEATQSTVPATNGHDARQRVDFKKQFGSFGIDGYTLTNPPESWLHLYQAQPLKLTLSLAKNKDGSMQTYVSSSDPNMEVSIDTTAFDRSLFDARWYEKIGIDTSLGTRWGGVVTGIGVSYDVGRYTFGPAMWMTVDDQVRRYYGMTFTWHPFKR